VVGAWRLDEDYGVGAAHGGWWWAVGEAACWCGGLAIGWDIAALMDGNRRLAGGEVGYAALVGDRRTSDSC
jgi:hypothetical protein